MHSSRGTTGGALRYCSPPPQRTLVALLLVCRLQRVSSIGLGTTREAELCPRQTAVPGLLAAQVSVLCAAVIPLSSSITAAQRAAR